MALEELERLHDREGGEDDSVGEQDRFELLDRLCAQRRREVLDEQLELSRLKTALERAKAQEFLHAETPRPGPLAFPLLVERLNNRMSNESVLERVERMRLRARHLEGSARHAVVSIRVVARGREEG